MKPIPEAIKILEDWGFVGIFIGEAEDCTSGDHMYVEGDTQDIANWLRPFDAVWRTKPGTSPMFQQFEAVHIPYEQVCSGIGPMCKAEAHTEFCDRTNG
ncbi:MAG: hypothetical protein ACXAC5_03850 [Promethearchaeota archaeon]